MSSERKIAANRRNGRKSRGPRTAAGKACASRNALRHGLATTSRHNPKLFPEIERMATALCNGDSNPLLFEQALVIAENELVLRCVRAEGVAVIQRLRDVTAQPLTRRDNSLARAKARFRLVKIKYKQLVQAKAARHKGNNLANPHQQGSRGEQGSGAAQAAGMQKPIRTRDEFDAMRHAMPDLERLARYERRAWSRRKRAIRDFIEIKSRIDG
jgi:hypothetical protein